MADKRSVIIKSEVAGDTVSKTFSNVALGTSVTMENIRTFGNAYVNLTSGIGLTATDRLTTESSIALGED